MRQYHVYFFSISVLDPCSARSTIPIEMKYFLSNAIINICVCVCICISNLVCTRFFPLFAVVIVNYMHFGRAVLVCVIDYFVSFVRTCTARYKYTFAQRQHVRSLSMMMYILFPSSVRGNKWPAHYRNGLCKDLTLSGVVRCCYSHCSRRCWSKSYQFHPYILIPIALLMRISLSLFFLPFLLSRILSSSIIFFSRCNSCAHLLMRPRNLWMLSIRLVDMWRITAGEHTKTTPNYYGCVHVSGSHTFGRLTWMCNGCAQMLETRL